MFDTALLFAEKASRSNFLANYNLVKDGYVLVTLHRAENSDDDLNLNNIFYALAEISKTKRVILPAHPRVRQKIETFFASKSGASVTLVPPLSYINYGAFDELSSFIY